jgi:hypothetical protein
MAFINLQKFEKEETIRVIPDEILLKKSHDSTGSMVSFRDGDSIHIYEKKKANRTQGMDYALFLSES